MDESIFMQHHLLFRKTNFRDLFNILSNFCIIVLFIEFLHKIFNVWVYRPAQTVCLEKYQRMKTIGLQLYGKRIINMGGCGSKVEQAVHQWVDRRFSPWLLQPACRSVVGQACMAPSAISV